jgi:hypothetical protein
MKLQTAKAGLCLVTLVMTGTTAAAAQQISAQASSSITEYSGKRAALSVLSSGKPSADESITVANAGPSLPDAPSAVAERQAAQDPPPALQSTAHAPRSPTSSSMGFTFVVANGMLLGSTIADAEMIARCRPSACQAVPDSIRSRADLYGIGIPASLAASYISYRIKRGGSRWWIVPVAVLTAGNVVYAAHAAQFSH